MRLIYQLSFLIIAAILFFTVDKPLYDKIGLLKEDVDIYTKALDSTTKLQQTRDNLVNIYKSVKQEDKDRLEHFLPSSVNNIQLILEIEKIAGRYGMPIKDIEFQGESRINPEDNSESAKNTKTQTDESLPYGVFPLSFSVDGKYNDFVSFLKEVELNLRMVDVKGVSFTVPLERSSATTIQRNDGVNKNPDINTFEVNTDIYWLK